MQDLTQELISFLKESPTAFHAAAAAARRLEAKVFSRLLESERWDIVPGGKYYVVRTTARSFAFAVGAAPAATACHRGLRTAILHL